VNTSAGIRFDGWMLDVSSGELVKDRKVVRLQRQPQLVLEELLARPGELVAREVLIARLWPRGIVNFDLSLNSAVRRLRIALDDCAETPRYIETVPRRGYRFVGHIEAAPADSVPAESRPAEAPADFAPLVGRIGSHWRSAAAVLLVAAASVGAGSLPQFGGDGVVEAPVAASDGRARDDFVRAEYLLHRRSAGDLRRARELLLDAVSIDPEFSQGWAALASAWWLATSTGEIAPEVGFPKVREAAERALALDPRSAEAHLRLANLACRTGDRESARRHLDAAAQVEPDNPLGLGMRAGVAAFEGRLGEAIDLQRRAVQREPLSLVYRQNLAVWLILADRMDEAKAEIEELRELHPAAPEVAVLEAEILVLQGRHDQALALANSMPDGVERRFVESVALFGDGDRALADATLARLVASSPAEAPALRIAEAHAFRGEADEAFDWLENVAPEQRADPSLIRSPFLRSLQSDPRWAGWVESIRPRVVAKPDPRVRG
jgi:DNA-binding winged helix-turn-helix (wHTH) protein/tetratricopeptide (TPR) repeat protein